MKLTKFFALLFAFSAMSFTFTACGDDEEDINNYEEEIEDSRTRVSFTKDTPTELELTISRPGVYNEIYNAKFDGNGIVTKVTLSLVYAKEDIAKRAYENLKEADSTVTLNGKTVTSDITEAYYGYTRDEVRKMFNTLKDMVY